MENNTTYATGRRKTSTARVYLSKGKGNILVNDLPLEEYFGREVAKILVKQPLVLLDMLESFDLNNYSNVLRWYRQISERPAVIKGYNNVGNFFEIPKP